MKKEEIKKLISDRDRYKEALRDIIHNVYMMSKDDIRQYIQNILEEK
jgi:hypothetical protein